MPNDGVVEGNEERKRNLTLRKIEEVLESKITHILHYHDKEGRTSEAQVIFRNRFMETAIDLYPVLKEALDKKDAAVGLMEKLAVSLKKDNTALTNKLSVAVEQIEKIKRYTTDSHSPATRFMWINEVADSALATIKEDGK